MSGGADNPSPVRSDPQILGGTPCFAGTRVPVAALFDYLERGETVDAFIAQFPTVARAQALAPLELAKLRVAEQERRSA
jgi:uncharacterized protein (DUF433 family)